MMKSARMLFALAVAIGFAAPVHAADVTGTWTAPMPGRGGETRETTFRFKVEGDTLTGTLSGPQGEIAIEDGKVQGDAISFATTLNFQGNEVKLLFRGQVSGDEIRFTRQRAGSDQTQAFTARRVPSPSALASDLGGEVNPAPPLPTVSPATL